MVTVSHQGYAKTQPLDTYQAQRRGGRGKAATAVKDEDFVEHLLVAHSHDTLLCFSNVGKVYWLRVFVIPQGSRGAKGRPMVNLLPWKATSASPRFSDQGIHLASFRVHGHGQWHGQENAVGAILAPP